MLAGMQRKFRGFLDTGFRLRLSLSLAVSLRAGPADLGVSELFAAPGFRPVSDGCFQRENAARKGDATKKLANSDATGRSCDERRDKTLTARFRRFRSFLI
jgi:hypothetical protein